MDSVFLVFLITAGLVVVGVLLRWRALVLSGGVIALGFTILWMVRQGQAAGELVISSNSRGLGAGVALAFGGSLLMIVGSLLMTGQRKQIVVRDRIREQQPAAPEPRATTSPAVPDTTAGTPVTPPAERTGTERLTKQEREMLGLDQDTTTRPKSQD
jgi:hypothetical protein